MDQETVKDEIFEHDFDIENPMKLISFDCAENKANEEDVSNTNLQSVGIDQYRLQAERENLCKLTSLREKCIQLDINNIAAEELLKDYMNIRNEEACNTFGLFVAKQLNCYPRKVAVICQKLMNEIILEAEIAIEMQWSFEGSQQDVHMPENNFDIHSESHQAAEEIVQPIQNEISTEPENVYVNLPTAVKKQEEDSNSIQNNFNIYEEDSVIEELISSEIMTRSKIRNKCSTMPMDIDEIVPIERLKCREYMAKHYLATMSTVEGRSLPKSCVVCKTSSKRPKSRKRVIYECKECNVPLCIQPCFMLYHSTQDY